MYYPSAFVLLKGQLNYAEWHSLPTDSSFFFSVASLTLFGECMKLLVRKESERGEGIVIVLLTEGFLLQVYILFLLLVLFCKKIFH